MRRSHLAVSMEAVAFQASPTLFNELTICIGELRKLANPTTKDIVKSNFAKLIKDELNLIINPQIDTASYPNAYVCPPALNKNHPLVPVMYRWDKGSADGLAAISANNGAMVGTVDLRNGRISGALASVECDMYLTLGLLANTKFNDDEIAAIVLHEIGHIETYLEFVAHTVATNYILSAVAKEWARSDSQVKRIQIVKDAERALKLESKADDKLADANDVTVVQTVLLNKAINETRSELGSCIYDMRAWEQLSDQFATRFGAGRALATGLDKIHRWSGSSSYYSTPFFIFMEAVKFAWWLATIFIGLIPIAALILMYNPSIKVYDEPGERISRIRMQLVEALKNQTISKSFRDSLLADLETIDALIEPINDRRGLLELFWTNITAGTRNQYDQTVFQQELEKLALNDLFAVSAKLKSTK